MWDSRCIRCFENAYLFAAGNGTPGTSVTTSGCSALYCRLLFARLPELFHSGGELHVVAAHHAAPLTNNCDWLNNPEVSFSNRLAAYVR